MSLAGNFSRTVTLMVAEGTTGQQVRSYIGTQAEINAQALIAAGRASPSFRRFVNGVENASNDNIALNGSGTIIYMFSSMALAALFALSYAIEHSPKKSGAYAASWYLLVNGTPFTGTDLRTVPLGSEITLSNHANYHRKIDVGGMRLSVAPQIVEQTRQATQRAFPTVTCERKFITIPGGYILKGRGRRSGISFDKRLAKQHKDPRKGFFQAFPAFTTDEKDRNVGQQMTYPSLIMRELV